MRIWFPVAIAWALTAPLAYGASAPPAVMAIIDAAADDPDTLSAVVKAVKKAHPDASADVDAYVAAIASKQAAELADSNYFEGWTGEVELGGAINTGNTDDYSFTAALGFDRKTPVWEHELDVRVSFKNEDGETTTDRYFANYAIARNLDPRLYVSGVLWAERDRFAGHNYRFSEGLGLGYRLIKEPDLNLTVEAGPALRQSEYLERGFEATVAARFAAYLTWRLRRDLEFKQNLVTYLDTKNSTALSTSALTTKLQGNVSARATYEVRHEDNPPDGREKTDTTAKVTLVVSY